MDQTIIISDMRQRPEFMQEAARHIWEEWWKDKGRSYESIMDKANESLADGTIPFTLIAHEGDKFAGTVSVIVSDMSERPSYTPWVAALWVDLGYRKRGIGARLVDEALKIILSFGNKTAYLCATRERRDFYLKRGWKMIEEDVGEKVLTIMTKGRVT